MRVRIDRIQVKRRIRKDLGNLDPLIESLRLHGLINPIMINKDYVLIAGERRLQSAKHLGWIDIPATVVDYSDMVRELELEIDENLYRKPLNDQELNEGYARLEKLRHPGFFKRIWIAIKEFFKRLFH